MYQSIDTRYQDLIQPDLHLFQPPSVTFCHLEIEIFIQMKLFM